MNDTLFSSIPFAESESRTQKAKGNKTLSLCGGFGLCKSLKISQHACGIGDWVSQSLMFGNTHN